MKNYIYTLLLLGFLFSCGDEDIDVYPLEGLTDTTEDFEALSLNRSVTNLTIEKLMDGEQKTLGAGVVFAGAPRSAGVSYSYEIIDPTTVDASTYQSSGTGQISGGEVTGMIPITLNLDAFEIGVPQAITIRLTGSNDVSIISSQEVTYNFSIVCPSDLAGTYSTETTGASTDGCCPGQFSATRTVVVTGSSGSYTVSDFSAGLYFDWYAVYGITAAFETDGRLNGSIQDVCGVISGSFNEPFGTSVTVTGSVSGGVITYTWVNGYGDSGTVVLTPQ